MSKKIKCIKIDESKLNDLIYWDYLFSLKESEIKRPKKTQMYQLLENWYKKSPVEIRHNREFVMKGLLQYKFKIWSVDEEIKDYDFCKEYVDNYDYPSVYSFPQNIQELLFEDCVKKYAYAINDLFYRENLYKLNTKENLKKLIELNPDIYLELQKKEKYRKDFELAEVAFKAKQELLFKMNKTIGKKIVSRNIEKAKELFKTKKEVFPFLPQNLRVNYEFVKDNINKMDYENLKYMGKELFYKEDILLGLSSFHFSLSDLNEELLSKRNIAKHLINIAYDFKDKLKDTNEFTIAELVSENLRERKNYYIYDRLNDKLKENEDILYGLTTIGYYYNHKKEKSVFSFNSKKDPIIEMFPEHIIQFLKNEYLELLKQSGKLTSDIKFKIENNIMNEELNEFANKYYLNIFLEKNLKKEKKHKTIKL